MPFVLVRDLQMYYEIRGAGSRVLFINGTGGDLRRSPNAFDFPLAQHFEVLAYDQRGLGQTSKPDVPYTMGDYADDAHALLDAVGWNTCQVIGVSFGGMVAQEFAIRYPQRVGRLILSCTSSGGAGGASYPLHELATLSLEEWTGRVVELSDTRRDPAWQAAHASEFQSLVAETLAGLKLGADEPGHAMGARRQVEARQEHDTYERLATLAMPVFIAGGRYDGIAEPRNKRAMLQQIASAQMELFEGGHQYFFQDPRAFGCLTDFFKGKRDSLRGEVTKSEIV